MYFIVYVLALYGRLFLPTYADPSLEHVTTVVSVHTPLCLIEPPPLISGPPWILGGGVHTHVDFKNMPNKRAPPGSGFCTPLQLRGAFRKGRRIKMLVISEELDRVYKYTEHTSNVNYLHCIAKNYIYY